jgi:ABC-type uncharacterized transport system substrate-binding protein
VTGDDLVRAQLVSSLAHPGGNVTGVSILGIELDGKRLELLTQSAPGAAASRLWSIQKRHRLLARADEVIE